MNTERRGEIWKIWEQVIALKTSLKHIRDQEQEANNTLRGGLHQSPGAATARHALAELNAALEHLHKAQQHMQNATDLPPSPSTQLGD